AAHGELLAEELVPFTRELSAQVARRPGGEAVAYPVVQTVQKDGVCYKVVAPAPGLDEAAQRRILTLALAIAEGLRVTGMRGGAQLRIQALSLSFAVDVGVIGRLVVVRFATAGGAVLVN